LGVIKSEKRNPKKQILVVPNCLLVFKGYMMHCRIRTFSHGRSCKSIYYIKSV